MPANFLSRGPGCFVSISTNRRDSKMTAVRKWWGRVSPRVRVGAVTVMLGSALTACQDLTGSPPLAAGEEDPTIYNTPDGARRLALSAINSLHNAMPSVIRESATLTDEIAVVGHSSSIDHRSPNDRDVGASYAWLQNARNNAQFARAVMRRYAPGDTAIIVHLYMIEGYADVLLAELFCSGIPLSTIDFQRDFTYRAGSTTSEVDQTAIALFDSATAMFSDTSSAFKTLGRIGKARALLQLGSFTDASQVVAGVQTDWRYEATVRNSLSAQREGIFGSGMSLANRDGGTGLPFVRALDPRAWPESTTVYQSPTVHFLVFFPIQDSSEVFGISPYNTITLLLASGVEARLLEAETELRTNPNSGEWLSTLNALRTTGAFTVTTRQNIPGVSPGPAGYPDTTWEAGTGAWLIPSTVQADNAPMCEPADPNTAIAPPCTDVTWYRGLAPLQDPGATLSGQAALDARVDLLFRERAFWLLLTGHREGDMRRLVRPTAAGGYGRRADRVYPSGVYPDGTPYGTSVVLPIPSSERANPHFTGCLSLGA